MTSTRRGRRDLRQLPIIGPFARLVATTFEICMRYRVTGLAAEAGYFALLSLPPLAFGLLGLILRAQYESIKF